MRFGKHTINPLALTRRLKPAPQEPIFAPVACEERDALLSSPNSTPQEVSVMADDAGVSGGDPTQRLLTALGRFQRHVARAEAGAAQHTWSDECMNQLIAAFEIAKKENWNDVVEALTETARVLQTYEESGRARDCVPFLADSYEILCLMVGDLIVGSVRSGVMEKWRRRYERALADIGAAGLKLLQDTDAASTTEATASVAPVIEEAPSPFELPPLEPLHETGAAIVTDEELPTLDDLPPLDSPVSTAPEPASASAAEEPETLPDQAPVELEERPMTTMLFDTELEEDTEEIEEEKAPVSEQPETASLSDKNGTSPQVVEVLDKLCECLSRLENRPDGDRHETGVAMEYSLTFLQRHARDYGRTGAVELCREMEKICRIALGRSGPLEDRFFELSYAFCGAYVDANSGSQDPIVTNWIEECEVLVEQWRSATTDTPAEPTAIDDTAATPEGSPESLLQTAQRAVERGNSADAKVLALQAAVNIARAESEEAEARVRTAESRLQDGAHAIEAAQTEVRTAEQSVSDTQAGVGSSESHIAECRAQVAAVERRLAESDARISDFEEQLRAIQAQLDAEVQVKGETLSELAGARQAEADAQARLEQALAEEDAARIGLEQARQQVKRLQQKRSEIEAALERMRDSLTRRRASLADIEQTMDHIRGASEEELPSDQDMLF